MTTSTDGTATSGLVAERPTDHVVWVRHVTEPAARGGDAAPSTPEAAGGVLAVAVSGKAAGRPEAVAALLGERVTDATTGIWLHTGDSGSAEAPPFDPSAWILHIGAAGASVGAALLVIAERVLSALPAATRATARVRILGTLDPQARDVLSRNVRRFRQFTPVSPEPVDPEAETPEAETPAADAVLPVVTTSGPPVATVSGGFRTPDPQPEAASEPPSATGPDTEHEPVPVPPPTAEPTPAPEHTSTPDSGTTQESGAAPIEPAGGPIRPPEPEHTPADVDLSTEDPEPEPAEPAEPPADRPEQRPVAHVHTGGPAVADRTSTAGERARFTAAAGDRFGEALAAVNGALATWPALRQESSDGFKADFVAVCLYLNESGGPSINEAIRTGTGSPLEDHVPCLASGVRRLPTHRRAVLRQSVVAEPVERRSEPGAVLTEPGFLTAAMDLGVTIRDAVVDILIWPTAARRTSELLVGRPADEAVFLAGARFKTLAVRTASADGETIDERDGVPAPKVAALLRELAPGEQPSGSELDDRDLAALAKLEKVLAKRRARPLRVVDDEALTGRLTSALAEWRPEAASADVGVLAAS